MRKQDQLLQLIASLSPNEKRYFKLFSIQLGDKQYIDLFDALEGKEKYDAKALSVQLDITPARLAVNKTYLTKALLRSLVNYDEDATDINILHHNYLESFALFERRLFENALEILEKAIAKAWELEIFNIIPLLINTQGGCLYSLSRFDKMPALEEPFKKATEAATEVMQMQLLRGRATSTEMRREGPTAFKELMKHPLLKSQVETLRSVRAQTAWFDIMHRYYLTSGVDKKKLLKFAHQELNWYEQRPQIKIISPVAYAVSFTRVAIAESEALNYKVAITVTQKLISVLADPSLQLSAARIKSLNFYAHILLGQLYCYNLEHGKAIAGFQKNYPMLPERPVYEQYTMLFHYATALLHTGKIHEALDQLNLLLQMKTDVRQDLQPYVRIIMIMLQVDLGNEEMVPYLVRTTKAWMKRAKLTSPESLLFLGMIYSYPTTALLKRPHLWKKLNNAVNNGEMSNLNHEIQLKLWLSKKGLDKD